MAHLTPKLMFFLPGHTALEALCLRFPRSSPLPQCGGRARGAAVLACHTCGYQARRVMRNELLNSCLEDSLSLILTLTLARLRSLTLT